MHRGITARCIGLSSRDPHPCLHPQTQTQTQTKQLKLAKVGYHTLLLDLHRSNAFGDLTMRSTSADESHTIPEAW